MKYEGPIYRPPSESDSLLVQATIGCPHNKCAFCTAYKKGPPFRIRSTREIEEDLIEAEITFGSLVKTIFFPAGNTIAMPTGDLSRICSKACTLFPGLERITVYGSSSFICRKGSGELNDLKASGLSRIHVGLESGDNEILQRIKKGTTAEEQIRAGLMVKDADIELSEYIILGIGGKDRTEEHARETARVLNAIDPKFIRFRTFLPKVNTLLLHQIRKGRFKILSAHDVLREHRMIIKNLDVTSRILSDHYTNYVDICGEMPQDKERMLSTIEDALRRDETHFRPVYVGSQ